MRKGDIQDIQYSMDYRKEPDKEYFTYFKEAGWTHVTSFGKEIHIFSASEAAVPLYTDQATIIEKYSSEKKKMGIAARPAFVLTCVFFLIDSLSHHIWMTNVIGKVSYTTGLLSLIVLIFTGMPYIAYSLKLNKLKKSLN